jgi:tyrosyl-tRNA synthetase
VETAISFLGEITMTEHLRSPLLRVLSERGFIKDSTDLAGLDQAMATGPVPAYIGFDLTASSLHVGSLIQLMVLGHIRATASAAGMSISEASSLVNVVVGDATTRVGDPSDKNGARPVLSAEAIEENRVGIIRCIDRIVGACTQHHNSEWLDSMSFMDFLTGPARQFSLNRMVAADVVKRRLDAAMPMTLQELIYQSMQAMDFAELARRKGVRLQIGGSDQWTNILAGVDLARRTDGTALFGITTPLMTDENGRKMGKTAEGRTIWLDPERTSSFELWQFWRNVPDGKVQEFLGLFTELPMDEVRRLGALEGAAINEAKIVLATEAVAIAHGRQAALDAAAAAKAASSRSGTMAETGEGLPAFRWSGEDSLRIFDVAILSGLCSSKADARRLWAQGGLRMNGVKILDADRQFAKDDFTNGALVLSAGRKRHARIVWDNAA